jgi:hypothetical protein
MHDPYRGIESKHSLDPLDSLLRSASWPDESVDPLDELLRMAQWPEPIIVPPVRTPPVDRTSVHSVAAASVIAISLVILIAAAGLYSRDLALLPPKTQDNNLARSAQHSPSAMAQTSTTVGTQQSREARRAQIRQDRSDRLQALHAVARRDVQREQLLARALPLGSSENDVLIRQFILLPKPIDAANEDAVIRPLMDRRSDIEQRLLETFDRFTGEQEVAAIELLEWVGSEKSVRLLMRLRLKPSTQRAATAALVKLGDPTTLWRMLRTESDVMLRDSIIDALREKADRRSLQLILASKGDTL